MATYFTTIEEGDFVLCKMTGEKIPLDELKYWSVERQEAYVDAEASLQRQRSLEAQEKPWHDFIQGDCIHIDLRILETSDIRWILTYFPYTDLRRKFAA